MMIKSMLMSLLTVMLLGIILSSKSVPVALNKSIHWLPIILKWTPSLSLEEKGPGPRSGLLQMWLWCHLPWEAHLNSHLHTHSLLRARGSTSSGVSKFPVHTHTCQTLLISHCNCLLTCLLWQTTTYNTGTNYFFHLCIPKLHNSAK